MGQDGASVDGAVDGAAVDAAPVDGAASDASGPPPSLPLCLLGCTTSADCVTASPAFDADNYRCEGGACRYTGCRDDAECRASFAANYVCRDAGGGVRTCLIGCASRADCGTGTPAFDEDNYTCQSGTCRYDGCNDDAECAGTFGSAYGCVLSDPPPLPLPLPVAARNCVRRCTVATDCATDSGAFDGNNYTCESGVCRHVGCVDDAECRASLASPQYVCR